MDVSTRLKLVRALQDADVPDSAYSVSGALDSALCLKKLESGEWEVFYYERGGTFFLKQFMTEDEACLFMYTDLVGDKTSVL